MPLATTSPSIHESDIDLRESPQPAHESPDPLDIITPADDDSELNPSPPHRHAETVQPSSPPPQLFERTDTTVTAEREHSEPPEIAEISGTPRDSEHLKPSEVVERSEPEVEIESDVPAAVSISDPVEGEMSADDRLEIVQKDDTSIRSLSEPPIVHAMRSPSPIEGATISAACTPKTDPFVTGPDGEHITLSSSTVELHFAEVSGLLEGIEDEGKEDIQVDEDLPEDTLVKQDDEMETEQDGHEAASPVESSRRDRKL